MELYHLRTFITVANEQNLTRAAHKLFTSPPSVSAHIKALEAELNLTLFTRTAKGMTLTEAGKTLCAQAEDILASAQNFITTSQTLRTEPAGKITFGLNIPPEWLHISTLVENTSQKHPHLKIEFVSSSTGLITEALLSGTMDVGCIYGTPTSEAIAIYPLIATELVIACPIRWQHKLQNATWADIAKLPWINDTLYCPFQVLANRLFEERGLKVNHTMTTTDDATRLELVKGGVGLSILERRFAEMSDQIVIWEVDEPLYSNLHFAHLKSRIREPAIQAMTEQVVSLWQTQDQIPKAG